MQIRINHCRTRKRKPMKKILLCMSLVLVVQTIVFAQQKPPATQQKPPVTQAKPPAQAAPPTTVVVTQKEGLPQVSENFVIGLEDTLAVSVWKEADHSAPQVVVRPDGMITLPLIGEIRAAGLTPAQLEANIAEKLKTFLTAPSVTVSVLKIESQKVSIVGQVGRQGSYPLGSPMTVLDLIAKAGGLTEYAKAKDIKILRKKDGKVLNFNYKDVIKGKNMKQNVFLENGDTVMVPG
jgi:polysaccharide biosynthesis/export protein